MRLRSITCLAVLTSLSVGALVPVRAQSRTAADGAAWDILRNSGTPSQLRSFIAREPPGPRRREAQKRLKALEAAGPVPELSARSPEHAMFYEEDPGTTGRATPGTAVWSVVPAAAGTARVAVRAVVAIPKRHVSVRLTLSRSDDGGPGASHTVEVVFAVRPPGIVNVPGMIMKDGAASRGMPLVGATVKVTDNTFLIGLSPEPAAREQNLTLLANRPWLEIPVVYANGKRALVTIEKGIAGEHAFATVLAAWADGDRR